MPPDAEGLIVDDGEVTVVLFPRQMTTDPNWFERVARILAALLMHLARRMPELRVAT
jgi:hypothetical protein